MEKNSKLRNNGASAVTKDSGRGVAGGQSPRQDSLDIQGEGVRGRTLNAPVVNVNAPGFVGTPATITAQGGGSSSLPQIVQTPKTTTSHQLAGGILNRSKGKQPQNQLNETMRLEVRGKDAHILMNSSMSGSFKLNLTGSNGAAAQQAGKPTPKNAIHLPNLISGSSPIRARPEHTSEYLMMSSQGTGMISKDHLSQTNQDPLNMTRQSFTGKSSVSNATRHQLRSVEPPSLSAKLRPSREDISADQYNQLVQVMNSTQNTNGGSGAYQPMSAQASVFGNYMMKVVQSVERRKNKKGNHMLLATQNQKLSALVDNAYLGDSKKTSNLVFQNFNNQLIPQQQNQQHEAKRQQKLDFSGSSLVPHQLPHQPTTNAIQQDRKDLGQSASEMMTQSNRASSVVRGSAAGSYQVANVGGVNFKSVFAEPKATEQVAFLLREAQKKDKIFIPLERAPEVDSALMYKEMKNAPDNHAGIVVFSKQGFVNVGRQKNATSTFVSNEQFITDGVNKYILRDLPFFKKFHAMKIFKQWKYIMKWNAYARKREQLANSLHLAKPIFSQCYPTIIPLINNVRTLPFVDIKQNVTYGKKQQYLLEDKCNDQLALSKQELKRTLSLVKTHLESLKEEITSDDAQFEHTLKERHMMDLIKNSNRGGEDLIVFSKARRQKEIEEEQFKVQRLRQTLFDKFVLFVLKIVCSNLIEAIYENKRIFKEIFRDQRLGPQFEVAIWFNEAGVLDSDPSMSSHYQSFVNVFSNIEVTIYQNQSLIDFINDCASLLFTEKQIYYKNIFENMKKVLSLNVKHGENHNQIFETLDKDIARCREYMEQFYSLQEIYDFTKDWEANQRDKQVSLEMSFYKETWQEVDKYAGMVDNIPTSNTKLGTILVETLSLKKYLTELPKKVIDSIRSNVTHTMEVETKSLREELSKTSEILDQLPGSLNVYVEQVNTLKYVKEKQEEFKQKFSTINKLYVLCKQDNIKVGLNLQQAIDEVSHLYETLPKLSKRAQDGLNSNKSTMEKIMHSSSLVLSKKIKAFERKYVETYLQDRSRIEDCADTLEELFKRSKAIHEIRSKVILYKEFLKLLYEDDPDRETKMEQNKLQCSEDYEFVAEVHKQTIKLWKMLLYWRKRRHMCYNTSFLSLDMNKIIRSINKINRYFEEKLSKHEFLKEKSRPLYKVVMLQVKETSLIIEFLKELRRESLKQRHWMQIFHLMKAPHLKNSTTFTIVNLREYHIQNYREEISKIIEHANTELKYERVFKSIQEEWDKHDLKIIPYKETMDSYILVNTENLCSAIEENLTTLENISQSKFAMHIKGDIEEQIKTLRVMLRNLEIWVSAQHHWINLDPILQSNQHMEEIMKNEANGVGFNLSDIDQQTAEFLDLRNQFKRIMWSSFKKPRATYNLLIKSRIEVFEKLIKHFSVLQKKVHDFLELRRRAFPRFFFLTDNQFLEFLTFANSNQDFNEYTSALFPGAHKLFINRVLGKDSAPTQEAAHLESFITSAIKTFDQQAANIEPTEGLLGSALLMPGGKSKKDVQQSIIVSSKGAVSLLTRPIDEEGAEGSEFTEDDASERGNMLRIRTFGEQDVNETKIQERGIKNMNGDLPNEKKVSETFEVLGMISLNKELFLFEEPIQMRNGVENWLVMVEQAMKNTISKQLSYAVTSFPNQPLDEWVLDYPQQIILTVLHLILSHEINEILDSSNLALIKAPSEQHQPLIQSQEVVQENPNQEKKSPLGLSEEGKEDKSTNSQRQMLSSNKSGSKSLSKVASSPKSEEEDDPGMAEYIRRKNELKAQQVAEEEEHRRKQAEESRKKFEANELPRDPEREKRRFIDTMFGRDFPLTSRLLQEELPPKALDVTSSLQSDSIKPENATLRASQQKALKALEEKKTDFKQVVLTNLNKKNLTGVNLRIQFWLNQVIKSLYSNAGDGGTSAKLEIGLHGISKMVLKSISSFLIYQRDIVENLMNKNITEVEDFEWQSQIRLFWTGLEPSCKVICGGWSMNQQNEYLGSQPRLIMTPLTNRYFVFISSALREKSAVLFNSTETSNSIAGDVFEEFSAVCMTPFKKVLCSPIFDLKPLMQTLNGAAFASFWVFYKNIDKLRFSYLQTFNKEIQMIQQHFIVNDLVGSSLPESNNLIQRDLQFTSSKSGGVPQKGKEGLHGSQNKVLGLFATMNARQSMKMADSSIVKQLSASFREISYCRFNERVLFEAILKTEGFVHYGLLAKLSYEFITSLEKTDSGTDQNDSLKHLLSLRDLRLVGKLACLIRDQEQRVYHEGLQTLRSSQLESEQKNMFVKVKLRNDRIKAQEQNEKELEVQLLVEKQIEIKSVQEGLRLVCRQKLFAQEWLQAKEIDSKLQTQSSKAEAIEKKLQELMETSFEKQKKEDDEALTRLKEDSLIDKSFSKISINKLSATKRGLGSVLTGASVNRRKSLSNEDVIHKYSQNVGLQDLVHNQNKVSENKLFIEQVSQVLKELVDKLNFEKSNAQLRNCINVIDFFRRTKAIAFVGPVCTGKTSILKIVSNVLHVAFKVKLRTSVVNTATMTAKDLYGAIDAFSVNPRTDKRTDLSDSSVDGDFSKSGIFKIILDVFEKEREATAKLPPGPDRPRIIQSIYFDSCQLDEPLSESLLDFIEQTNKREELRRAATEYQMSFNLSNQISPHSMSGDVRIPVTFPNGNVLQFPTELFLFFETTSLKDASPPFISKVGLILTEQDDITWMSILKRQEGLLYKKQAAFFEEIQYQQAFQHLKECFADFVVPFLEKVCAHPRISQWEFFNSKAHTLQLFNILNCVFFKLNDTVKQRKHEEDEEYASLLSEVQRDVIWSNVLMSTLWSFGALLSRDLRKQFEEVFAPFKRKFNISMSQSAAAQTQGTRVRFTMFDIFYDPESLQWELLMENMDYKLKLQYDPMNNQLMIPTVETSQCFFMMDVLLGVGPKYYEGTLDNKHFRVMGPNGTGKSFAVNAFLKKVHGESRFQLVQIPMSAYVTIERIKENVEELYFNKRRNLLEPKDKERPIVLLVEDVHLQSNLTVNILEFLRTWCMSKGYYDIQQGFFKGVGQFVTACTENTDYRRAETLKFPGRAPLNSRFLFYANSIYLDEFDASGTERFKSFAQQWLTSKLWGANKLLTKYYILIQNTVLLFIEKVKRIDALHNSSLLNLSSFHLFQRFCSNLVTYTAACDEIEPGLKEEDYVSNLMVYELMRVYGDRTHRGAQRTTLMQKIGESCKQEFIGRSAITPQAIDSLILGNYHTRRETAQLKYSQVDAAGAASVKDQIRKMLRASSNNTFLEGILESPTSVREVFKMSRILFKERQHAIVVGPAGCGKLEYLQLAAILNEALIFELNCSRLCDALRFVKALKHCVLSAVGLNKNSYILISDSHLRDPIYIDYLCNFIQNMTNKFETTLLWGDKDFKNSLVDIERQLYLSQPIKRASEPTEDQLLTQAMRKMVKNIHFVFMIDDFSSYFEWVSLFPQMEVLCEVCYVDETSTEGYKQFTQSFFSVKSAENQHPILNDPKLTNALVELRQHVKNNVVNTFYSLSMLKNTSTEEFMTTSLTEYIFNNEDRLNGFLYSDGDFKLRDPNHRQYNYNVPVTITSLYKTKYSMFLELFRYFYDLMSLGLTIRCNYYEAFLRKSGEFSEFFKDIKSTKVTLHGQSHQLSVRAAQIRDKIDKLKILIEDRERLVAKKLVEIKEVDLELRVNKDEVNNAVKKVDRALDEALAHLEKVTGSEFIQVLSIHAKFSERDVQLLTCFAVLIEKNGALESYDKAAHFGFFQDREELIQLLDERRRFAFDDSCYQRFRELVTAHTQADFRDKPLFKILYAYFAALQKKLSLKNAWATQYSRIKQCTTQLDQIQFTVNYSRNFVKEKKQDLAELEERYRQLTQNGKDLSLKIEDAEISHMRTEHIIDQVEKYTQKMLAKLVKTRKRLDTLLGDALIMATSVAFLGAFSIKERKQIRKDMAEYLIQTSGGLIKCGLYWLERGAINNSKMFRAVLKEFGVGGNAGEDILLSSLPQGILSQESLIESLFTLMFAPSCPYVVDPTGRLQEFITTQLMSDFQVKSLYGSDQNVSLQIEQVLRSSQFTILNDLNDNSSSLLGLSQDEPLLSRLAHFTHNGFEFNSAFLKDRYLRNLLKAQAAHTTHSSVNKRVSVMDGSTRTMMAGPSRGSFQEAANQALPQGTHYGDIFSFYQVQIFTPRFDLQLNPEYLANATVMVAVDEDETSFLGPMGTNSAWVDIKELMLKHFLPEECQNLKNVKEKILRLERHRSQIRKNFENAFLISSQETLQKISDYSLLKQSVEDIRFFEDEKKILNETFQKVLSSHPLLSSYANVITIMYHSLKKLSKITGQITFSWKSYLTMIDSILEKTVRELTAKAQQKHKHENEKSATSIEIDQLGKLTVRSTQKLQSLENAQIDFTLDEAFFSNQVVPQINGVLRLSIKSELVSLYNLIFAVKLSFKKKEITDLEVDYFFKQLFCLKEFEAWRNIEQDLVSMEERVDKSRFLSFKRDLIKVYPENGRKIVDIIEKDISQTFTYGQANKTLNFKVFANNKELANMPLFQQINVGFICPDHEFKGKLIRLVYEQLSSVFSFTERPLKLHEFVRVASWTQPIAIIPTSTINTISSICSVASHYGVNVEVLRSSELPSTSSKELRSETSQASQGENAEVKALIESQLQDYIRQAPTEVFAVDAATYKRDSWAAIDKEDKVLRSVHLPKVQVESLQAKEAMRQEEKSILGAYQAEDPLQVIEKCALQGQWVFISSIRFPAYWHKLHKLLTKAQSEGSINKNFRLFIDLQGYQQNEIPDSFLFDSAIPLYLTEASSSEDGNAPSDIWASLLNPQVLNELTDYRPHFEDEEVKTSKSEVIPKVPEVADTKKRNIDSHDLLKDSSGGTFNSSYHNLVSAAGGITNLAMHQEQTITDDKKRDLYNQYMRNMQPQAEQVARNFNEQLKSQDQYLHQVMRAGRDSSSSTESLQLRTKAERLAKLAAESGDIPTLSNHETRDGDAVKQTVIGTHQSKAEPEDYQREDDNVVITNRESQSARQETQ